MLTITSLHEKQHGVTSQAKEVIQYVRVVMFWSAAILLSSQFEPTLHQIWLECVGMHQNDGPRFGQWNVGTRSICQTCS